MSCLICNRQTFEVVDLGMQPFADSFFVTREAAKVASLYPLVLRNCSGCGLLQLESQTDAESRYNGVDYSYTSSNSNFAKAHWQNFAQSSAALSHNPKFVLEIGSNDGYLLSQLKDKVKRVQGVDASAKMVSMANERGIPSTKALFGSNFADSMSDKYDLVIANNVFNHADNPMDFLTGVTKILTDEGRFVFEVPSAEHMLTSGRYDQIYLEHITYWSPKSLANSLARAGLDLVNYEIVDYHGGSIRGVAEFARGEAKLRNLVDIPQEMLASFAMYVSSHKEKTRAKLEEFKDLGKIVGVGAAAKANTTINYLGLGDFLSYVTDASPEKIGKFTPKSALEILPDDALDDSSISRALLLAWNISDDLRKKIRAINPRIELENL